MTENIENNTIKKTRPKKTLDEKIAAEKLKLKNLEELKKKSIQRKGVNLWRKIKHLFLNDEEKLEELLKDDKKIDILKSDLEYSLKKIFKNKEEAKNEGE